MTPPGRRLGAWWARLTLRSRLALWYAVGGTALVSIFAATLYAFVAVRLARPLDHQLRQDLTVAERNLRVTAAGMPRWQDTPLEDTHAETNDHPWFELWDEQGQLVVRRWPFPANRNLQLPGAPNRLAPPGTVSVISVASDLRLRTLTIPFPVEGGGGFWMLRLIRVHQPHADALPDLQLIIVATLPVVVALLVAGGYYFTRRWLLPLDRMAAEAQRISAEDLGRRLPVANPHDELGRLAGVFNVTLDRLQNSFEALDRFVADASHELRTPLTTLRSVGEVGLRRGRSEEEYRDIIASMLEEAQRLQQLVERLLQLASAEGRGEALHPAPVVLDELLGACAQELGILAEQKNQRLVVGEAGLRLRTDPVILRQALQNLIDNAIKYGPPDSEVRVSSRAAPGCVLIEVADEGPGISAEDRTHLTGRFYRTDRARGRASGGFGLGLAITKAYLRALGGGLEHEPRSPHGSIFRLRLPDEAARPELRPASGGDAPEPKLAPAAAGAQGHPFPEPIVPRVE
ncbi:MAG: sensor histidine kinase [Opitutaceae bacterium]